MSRHLSFLILVAILVSSCRSSGIDRDYNPYSVIECSEVLEYTPAPGQFIGDGFKAVTPPEACTYAQDRIKNRQFVCLGAFGGYIVAKFEGSLTWNPSIVVIGNQTESSSEPGIIYYMFDDNGNGLPDEEWTEVEGSLHGTDEEIHGYSVTYYRGEDGADIKWTDSLGEEGYIRRNIYHNQPSYYPAWISEDRYTLSGVRLKSRAYDKSGDGSLWINPSYGSGYADNYSKDNEEFRSRVNKKLGNDYIPQNATIVHVDGPVSFVKVQAAVNDSCGWIGEISTEVCGIFAIEAHFLE